MSLALEHPRLAPGLYQAVRVAKLFRQANNFRLLISAPMVIFAKDAVNSHFHFWEEPSIRERKKAHKHKQILPVTARVGGGLPPGWPGVSRPVARGPKVYVLCAEPKEHKHFRPGTRPGGFGYPAGRIGDRGDQEIGDVPNVFVPFPAPIHGPMPGETFDKLLGPSVHADVPRNRRQHGLVHANFPW